MPEAANRIAGQNTQAFWVDVWIPADAAPQTYRGSVQLSSATGTKILPLTLNVRPATIPDRDAVTLDNNSYGTSWLLEQYPETLAKLRRGQGGEDELFRLIHEYHRIFTIIAYLSPLGLWSRGQSRPEFAPELSGSASETHCELGRFDRHYGPCSMFCFPGITSWRSSHSIRVPAVNPDGPHVLLWGEPGYEASL